MSDQSLQIYIRGFPKATKESDLKSLFEKFGTIKEARIINAYAFIGYDNEDSVKQAVKQMNDYAFDGSKIKVEVAGKPKKQKGPQPSDECRFCKKTGHWKNSCPEYRRNDRDRRRRSSSSSSSSSSSDRKKKRRRRRSPSSDSDSSNSSSSSSSSKSRDKRDKKKGRKQKNQNGKKQQESKH